MADMTPTAPTTNQKLRTSSGYDRHAHDHRSRRDRYRRSNWSKHFPFRGIRALDSTDSGT